MTENTTPASEELYSRLPAVHRIDAADNISFIGGSWRTFAEQNGCPGLADSVLGRSLWDYIGGREVIEFNKLLFGILRDEFEPGDRITITGRCDSPDVHRDMLYELMPYGTGEIEIRSMIRVAHKPRTAIIQTVREHEIDYLLMGRHGKRTTWRSRIGSNIDRVVKETNTHAVICENLPVEEAETKTRRVLVPVEEPWRAPLAIGVAAALIPSDVRGQVTLLHLSEHEMSEEERSKFRNAIREQAQQREDTEPASLFDPSSPVSIEFRTIEVNEVADIVKAAEEYDRIVLSTRYRGFLERQVVGETARALADHAHCPVVFVNPKEVQAVFNVQHFFEYFRELEEKGKPESPESGKEEESGRSSEKAPTTEAETRTGRGEEEEPEGAEKAEK